MYTLISRSIVRYALLLLSYNSGMPSGGNSMEPYRGQRGGSPKSPSRIGATCLAEALVLAARDRANLKHLVHHEGERLSRFRALRAQFGQKRLLRTRLTEVAGGASQAARAQHMPRDRQALLVRIWAIRGSSGASQSRRCDPQAGRTSSAKSTGALSRLLMFRHAHGQVGPPRPTHCPSTTQARRSSSSTWQDCRCALPSP